MKTILMMIEVEDSNYENVLRKVEDAFEDASIKDCRITAYETYAEDESIPDIMKRGE